VRGEDIDRAALAELGEAELGLAPPSIACQLADQGIDNRSMALVEQTIERRAIPSDVQPDRGAKSGEVVANVADAKVRECS